MNFFNIHPPVANHVRTVCYTRKTPFSAPSAGRRPGHAAPPGLPLGLRRLGGRGSVRGSPCDEPARLRFTSLRPPSCGDSARLSRWVRFPHGVVATWCVGRSGGFHAAPRTTRWMGTPPERTARWGSVWSAKGDIPGVDAGEGEECPPPARNRSERSKVANVAEGKPPASTEAQCSPTYAIPVRGLTTRGGIGENVFRPAGGGVAQLGEHHVRNVGVGSSILLSSTTFSYTLWNMGIEPASTADGHHLSTVRTDAAKHAILATVYRCRILLSWSQ
jgi:hypothetical protein